MQDAYSTLHYHCAPQCRGATAKYQSTLHWKVIEHIGHFSVDATLGKSFKGRIESRIHQRGPAAFHCPLPYTLANHDEGNCPRKSGSHVKAGWGKAGQKPKVRHRHKRKIPMSRAPCPNLEHRLPPTSVLSHSWLHLFFLCQHQPLLSRVNSVTVPRRISWNRLVGLFSVCSAHFTPRFCITRPNSAIRI